MGIAKRARKTGGRQMVAATRSARMSGRYNRAMSSRLQRAPGMSRETGYVDAGLLTLNADTTGSIALLNTVPQGAGVSQRVGKKIMLKSLQVRGSLNSNAACINVKTALMIVYDKRPTGALPAITDILDTITSTSLNNDANSGRFSILKRWDEVIIGNGAAPANYTDAMFKNADFYIPLALPTTFKAAGTGAIGDIENGALYIVSVGSTTAGTGAATYLLRPRVRFLDI